jgi:hypothetical protein
MAGEFTVAVWPGTEIVSGKPHKAAGGGSVGGGMEEMLEGAVGVMGQSAMYFGRPWHPFHKKNREYSRVQAPPTASTNLRQHPVPPRLGIQSVVWQISMGSGPNRRHCKFENHRTHVTGGTFR